MPAATLNYSIEKGTDFEITFQYNDNLGNPINLIDKCIVLQLVPSDGDGSCLTFSSNANASLNVNGWLLTGNSEGQIVFKLLSSETNELDFTSAKYDLDIIDYAQNNQFVSSTRIATGTIFTISRVSSYLTSCPITTTYRGECGNVGGSFQTRKNYNNTSFVDSFFNNSVFTNVNFTEVVFDNCVFTNADFSNSDTTNAIFAVEEPSAVDNGQEVIIDDEDLNNTQNNDLCIENCLSLDLYSVVYPGSGISILDEATTSGTISILESSRTVESIDIAIGGLSHSNPQDLIFSLIPPSGSGVLLSSNHKIPNYKENFNYIFSNKASPTKYLHNINNGEYCRIYDKSNPDYLVSFDHFVNHVPSGDWTLYIQDTDPVASGSIDSWRIIITYNP